jgi:hypothetical protein
MKKLFSLIIVTLTTLVSAQTLPCESLLANYPMPKVELTSMVQMINSTMTLDGQEMQTTMSQTVDYVNRRAYQEMNAMGANTVMRFSDGKASMSMTMGEETMNVPIPAENAKALEFIFDQGVAEGLPKNFTIVSCDGQKSYAGLLSGEQVTVLTEIPGSENTTSKIIFDADGKTQGAISSVAGQGEMLMVFEELTLDASNVPVHMKMSMYRLKGDTASLFTTTSMDILSYNQPLDESIFAE